MPGLKNVTVLPFVIIDRADF